MKAASTPWLSCRRRPTGDTGTLEGTVTGSGSPLAGATVEITGDSERSLTTDDDGTYSTPLTAGNYTADRLEVRLRDADPRRDRDRR